MTVPFISDIYIYILENGLDMAKDLVSFFVPLTARYITAA